MKTAIIGAINMKKLFIFAISAMMMLCPLTVHAAQSEEAKAVYLEMESNNKASDNADIYYDMVMKVSGSMLDDLSYYLDASSLDIRLEMNTKMNHMTDPANMRYMAYLRMTLLGEEVEGSIYYENGWAYTDMYNQKIKQEMSVSEMMSNMNEFTDSFVTTLDYMDELSLTTDGENRILNYTLNDTKFNEYLSLILGTASMSSLLDDATVSIRNASGNYVINPEGYCTNAKIYMDMSMTMYGETINISIDANVGYANPGQPVSIDAPNTAAYASTDYSSLVY